MKPVALVMTLALAALVQGQHPATKPQVSPLLEPEPLIAQSFGLEMHVPRGAIVNTQIVENRLIYTIGAPDGVWSMRLQPLTTQIENPTPLKLAEEKVGAMRDLKRDFRILLSNEGKFGTVDGWTLFLSQPLEGQGAAADGISGWLIMQSGGPAFIVLSFVTTGDRWPALRPVIEASFASTFVHPPGEVLAAQAARLERGRAMVDAFTPDRLRAALTPKSWYRVYLPGRGGGGGSQDIEVGFMTVEARAGWRGELTPERAPSTFKSAEADEGLLVALDARVILDVKTQHYLDIQGRYWMAWDRREESWSVRQTERIGKSTKSSVETGNRTGQELQVIQASRDELTRVPVKWTIQDKAYLSQPEVLLLGSLLPRDGTVTDDLSFYSYDPRTQRLPIRIDSWRPDPEHTGLWLLVTRSLIEPASINQFFDSQGNRVRRVDGDGKVTERIDADALRHLWQQKGLVTQ